MGVDSVEGAKPDRQERILEAAIRLFHLGADNGLAELTAERDALVMAVVAATHPRNTSTGDVVP